MLPRIKFIKNSGLSATTIIGLFLLKVLAGIIYGWINFQHLKTGSDTFNYFRQSIVETDLLFSNPAQYFKDFFVSSYASYGNFLDTSNSFWNDLSGTLLGKLLSIFNILSFKNYYIDSLFFNVLIFFSTIALYRVFIHIYPKKTFAIIAGVFFIPSVLYFTSGIHKDGLVFLSIAGSIFFMQRLLNRSSCKKGWSVFFLFLNLLLLFIIRNFFLLALIPGLLCWWVSVKFPKKALLVFLSGYAMAVLLFFIGPAVHPALNFPEKVCQRQYAFMQMDWAKSYIETDSLHPNITSFVTQMPQAVNHAFLRPYLTESYTPYYLAAGIETILLLGIVIVFIFFRKPISPPFFPVVLFCLFTAVSCMLIIGYTIPIMGAIIRYKSAFLPLLFIPLFCNTTFNQIKNRPRAALH